jgi:hypothetical protein
LKDRSPGGEHDEDPVARPNPQFLKKRCHSLGFLAQHAELNRLTGVEAME